MMAGGSPDERTPPMTPQLALRVALVGGCALAMFALIFFRLWFLQVLDGSHYQALAQTNVVRTIPIAAARGEIVDRNNTVLVGSEQAPAVLISPESLPTPVTLNVAHPGELAHQPADDLALYRKLARLLGTSTKPATCNYEVYLSGGKIDELSPKLAQIPCLVAQGVAASQFANVTIKSDVSVDVQDYIAERQSQFPGVLSQEIYIRTYPLKEAGAQVFGTLGAISTPELHQKHFKSIAPGSVVGQNGLEYFYNQWLQGTDGEERVRVNSQGEFEGYAKETEPQQGDTLKTSFDARLEEVAQAALDTSITDNASAGADAGAFVALNPQNGSVYAMGSAPSFNPTFFTHPFTESAYEKHFLSKSANAPQLNRAISGQGPDGSTFKVITSTAALQSGKWSADEDYYDDGEFCFPNTTPAFCLHNAGDSSYGNVDLEQALEVSDDVYFYHLGYLLNGNPVDYPRGWPLQKWAKAFGIGQATGVDLPAEVSGTLPSPAWRARRNELERECDSATGPFRYTNGTATSSKKLGPKWHRSRTHAPGGCELANLEPWTVGDDVNEAVGQGDVQVTPLQLAVVYSAIANGGRVVTPHVAEEIVSTKNQVLQTVNPAAKRQLDISPSVLSAIRTGLNLAAQGPQGTSDDVMGNFPMKVYAKTGTAQYGTAAQIKSKTESDYAWYACYVPRSETSKPIVIVVWVEKGGFGDVAAAPVARQMLNQWFFGKPGPYTSGKNADL